MGHLQIRDSGVVSLEVAGVSYRIIVVDGGCALTSGCSSNIPSEYSDSRAAFSVAIS
jgi:hypothetical protein